MGEVMEFVFRPAFITMILVLLLLLILVLFKVKLKQLNGFTVMSISLICLIVAAINIWQEGIVVDELNLVGDSVSFVMFLVIVVLSFLNPVLFSIKRK